MKVVVVGAGIAGLVAARHLALGGADVTVLDAGPVGGHARTIEHDGYRLEWGPHTLTSRATTLFGVADALGVPLDPTAGPSTRYLYRNGRLHALGPLAPLRAAALSYGGWARLLCEPFVRSRGPDGESVHDFFARRIGPEAAHVLVGSFVSGIHGGDPAALDAAEAFPTMVAAERDHGGLLRGMLASRRAHSTSTGERRRGVVALRGGFGALTGALAASLPQPIQTGTPVTGLRRRGGWHVDTESGSIAADAVVLAVPPPAAARLLAPLDAEAATALASIPMAPLAVVHFGGRAPNAPRGFGALIPRGEGVRTLGVLFVGSQLHDRMPGPDHWLHAAFVGGATDPGALALSDEALAALAVADSARITGFDAKPDFTRVIRHPAAIPQLVTGHRARVAAVDRFPDLAFAGNWTLGVSADDAARSGVLAAERLLARAREAA